MKTKSFILTLSVFLVSMFSLQAALILETFSNKAERDALLSSDDTSITATAVVRAGGVNTYELGIGNFETLTDFGNLTWNINGNNSFSLSYSGGTSGNYDLGISNANGGDTVNTGPGDWFNQLAFSFESGGIEIDFSGNINGEPFNTFNSSSSGQWDGILFTFPEFNASHVGSFTITGTMDMSTALPALGGDQFRGEFYLIKNPSVIPEPSSLALVVSALVLSFVFLKRNRA